ncbi:MAG: hydrogenase formation protein HypD [Elusimicrobiales bacterium]
MALDNAALAAKISAGIAANASAAGRPVTIMEVCGTHTMSIARHGLRALLPESIRLVSGPGCPVCVSSQTDIDRAAALAFTPGAVIAAFGDMLKVRGSSHSLESAKAAGADVRIVYSPEDAAETARRNPSENVIFIGAGFETTAPAIAAAVLRAADAGINNFFVLPMLKLVPPALEALLSGPARIDGFLLPGHVSAVIGLEPYGILEGKVPAVVAGFEPLDILHAVNRLAAKIAAADCSVENCYPRAVRREGNPRAVAVMRQVFEPARAEWRALGEMEMSGLVFRQQFRRFDAAEKFGVSVPRAREPQGCICGLILTGRAAPRECPLFGKRCVPADAVGPCMVSSEGACAAAYHYG